MLHWVPNKKINPARVQDLLQSSILTNQFTNNGPAVAELEKKVRTLLKIEDSKSVVCVSNGTVALWAAVAAMELYESKELQFCTQSFTFPASAQGYLENVIIIDIDKEGGIDLSAIDPTSCDGIIITNIFGNLVDHSKYEAWCKEHQKFLIFDNAATSYSFYQGKNSCNYGNASTISFHHTKPIGFGEGGCIIIDSKYERSLRNIINFGIDNTSPLGKWHRKGGNYKMSDPQAVYVHQYLDQFDSILEKTTELYRYFLTSIASSSIQTFPNFSDDVPFVSCICVLMENSKVVMERLLENHIYCRKYYHPLIPTPNAVEIYDHIICISCTVDMTKEDIDRIVQLLLK